MLGDNTAFIVPWKELDAGEYRMLERLEDFSTDMMDLGIYIPKLFIKNSKGLCTEYLQLHVTYYEEFGTIKKEMIT